MRISKVITVTVEELDGELSYFYSLGQNGRISCDSIDDLKNSIRTDVEDFASEANIELNDMVRARSKKMLFV